MKPHRAMRWRWPAGVAPWVALVMLPVLVPACSPSQAKYAYGWERWFYPSISGRVVDADTGGPIEGAVVFCVWTKQHGLPGLMYTKVAKVSESVSDREGRFRIDGAPDPNVEPPSLTVYKKGYVAWSNKEVFPTLERRKDFAWRDDVVIRMHGWQGGFSFVEHEGFISKYTSYSEIPRKNYRLYEATTWEIPFYVEEMNERNRRRYKPEGTAP